jgi:IS1 family transposase
MDKQKMVLSLLVEGSSIRSIERITGVHRDTIMRLMNYAGSKAQEILDNELTGLECKRVQVDEIWGYVGMKQKTLKKKKLNSPEFGDQYVYVSLCADSKLIINHFIGKRDYSSTYNFIYNLSQRIKTRFQLSSDSFNAYFNVIDNIYGEYIDYGQIHKRFQEDNIGEKRYSPAKIIDVTIKRLLGRPKTKHISTSYVERQNLTIRMQMRRFTRLTNAFSKKLDNLKSAVALHFFHYNFMRIHKTLSCTPAMEAKLTNTIWSWEDLLENYNLKQVA